MECPFAQGQRGSTGRARRNKIERGMDKEPTSSSSVTVTQNDFHVSQIFGATLNKYVCRGRKISLELSLNPLAGIYLDLGGFHA